MSGFADADVVARVESAIRSRDAVERNAEILFRCPSADRHTNGDAKPSARWNRKKATWYCDPCGIGGGAVDLAQRLRVALARPGTNGNHAASPESRTRTSGNGRAAPDDLPPAHWRTEHERRVAAFLALPEPEAASLCAERRLDFIGAKRLGVGRGTRWTPEAGDRVTVSQLVEGPDLEPCGIWERCGEPGKAGRGKAVRGGHVGTFGLAAALRRYDERAAAGLPAVLAAVESESELCAFLGAREVEGDTSPLCAFGMTGCNVAKRLGDYAPAIGARRVAFMLNDDAEGVAANEAGALALAAAAGEVRIVPLPISPAERLLVDGDGKRAVKDVRALLGPDGGRSLGDLWAAFEAAPRFVPPAADEASTPADDSPEPKAEPSLVAVTLGELLNAKIPAPDWIVEGLLVRRGVTGLIGDPKAGKSLAALGLAVRTAEGFGETWLGSAIVTRSGGLPVVVLSAEGGLAMLQPRARVLAAASPEDTLGRLHFVCTRPYPRLDTPRGLAVVGRLLRDVGAGLLILDPLVRFRDVEKENDNAAAVALAEGLRELAETTNAAVLLLHHPGRAGQRDEGGGSFRGGRGASALEGELDALISLRRMPRKGEVHAFFELRLAAPIEPGRRLVLNRETLWLDHAGDLGGGTSASGAAVRAVSDEELVAALRAAGRPLRGIEWARLAGLSDRNLRRRVPDLMGAIETTPGERNSLLFRIRSSPEGALEGREPRTKRTTAALSGRGSEDFK